MAMKKMIVSKTDDCTLSEIHDVDSEWSCLRLEFITSSAYNFKHTMKEIVNGAASSDLSTRQPHNVSLYSVEAGSVLHQGPIGGIRTNLSYLKTMKKEL